MSNFAGFGQYLGRNDDPSPALLLRKRKGSVEHPFRMRFAGIYPNVDLRAWTLLVRRNAGMPFTRVSAFRLPAKAQAQIVNVQRSVEKKKVAVRAGGSMKTRI